MVKLNKHTKRNLNQNQHSNLRIVCAFHYAQLSYTIQYRTVLILPS